MPQKDLLHTACSENDAGNGGRHLEGLLLPAEGIYAINVVPRRMLRRQIYDSHQFGFIIIVVTKLIFLYFLLLLSIYSCFSKLCYNKINPPFKQLYLTFLYPE